MNLRTHTTQHFRDETRLAWVAYDLARGVHRGFPRAPLSGGPTGIYNPALRPCVHASFSRFSQSSHYNLSPTRSDGRGRANQQQSYTPVFSRYTTRHMSQAKGTCIIKPQQAIPTTRGSIAPPQTTHLGTASIGSQIPTYSTSVSILRTQRPNTWCYPTNPVQCDAMRCDAIH